jgi:hypothetical protein
MTSFIWPQQQADRTADAGACVASPAASASGHFRKTGSPVDGFALTQFSEPLEFSSSCCINSVICVAGLECQLSRAIRMRQPPSATSPESSHTNLARRTSVRKIRPVAKFIVQMVSFESLSHLLVRTD